MVRIFHGLIKMHSLAPFSVHAPDQQHQASKFIHGENEDISTQPDLADEACSNQAIWLPKSELCHGE